MDFFVSFELFLLFLHYGLHVMGAAKAQDFAIRCTLVALKFRLEWGAPTTTPTPIWACCVHS
jgi:hypothetical protein